jgi:hypothetical protein
MKERERNLFRQQQWKEDESPLFFEMARKITSIGVYKIIGRIVFLK